MEPETSPRRTAARIVAFTVLALLFATGSFYLFLWGMCTADGLCGETAREERLAYMGALVGGAGAGAAAGAAIRPRRVPVLIAAAVGLAVVGYAITQVDA